MYYQPNPYQPNPYMPQYGGPVPQMPKAKMVQPLSSEIINKLRSSGDNFDIKVSQEDLWRAACTHKENGTPTLVSEGVNPETGNEILRCTICGKSFEMTEATEEEVQKAVNLITNLLQTSKTMYLDAPKALVEQFYQILPLLEMFPKLYTRAMKNFNMYENALGMNPVNTVAGTNGFQMMGAMLSNPYGYAYPQPQVAPTPWGMPQAPVQQPAPMQQPMMQPWGYPQQPMANPMMYNAPAAAPAPAPAVPVAPAAPVEGTEVTQQKQFNV